ncbi:MAG: hypothetical protein SGILL_008016, partial [Bacillariaceae sp.]
MADACGTASVEGGPAICAVPVYPRAVTASLRNEMKQINLQDMDRRAKALKNLKLPGTMAPSSSAFKTMRDAAMIELQFAGRRPSRLNDSFRTESLNDSRRSELDGSNRSALMQEVDVVRGKEMVKHQTKS